MVFVVVDKEVDNLCPTLQSFAAANEKVLFIENMQNLVFEIF